MSVAENVLSFQAEIAKSEGLISGVLMRGLWHLNVEFKIKTHVPHSDYLKPDEVYLEKIKATIPKTRFMGGSRALDWLNSLADEFQVTISLFVLPTDHKALNKEELITMYEKKGYKPVNDTGLMKREPVV